MKRICVFCGSNAGDRPAYVESARRTGRVLAEAGLGVVYGGGRVGLMGALADAALEAGAEVIGVIPRALAVKEVAHDGLTRLEVVADMHERKARMAELSDAFVALPGGLGTLEELFEVLTWAQLGFHRKPCALLDVEGFYAPLVAFLDHATDARFLGPEHRRMLVHERDPGEILQRFRIYVPPDLPKWLDGTAI